MTKPAQTLTQDDLAATQTRLAQSWLPRLRERRIQVLATLSVSSSVSPATYYLVEDKLVAVPSGRSEAKKLANLNAIGIALLVVDRSAAAQLNREPRPWDIRKIEQTMLPGPQALQRAVGAGLLEGKIFEPYVELRRHELGAFIDEWRRRSGEGSAIPAALLRAVKAATKRRLTEYLPQPTSR